MMENCANCDAKITDGGVFGTPNTRYSAVNLKIVNFINDTDYTELCEKCGKSIVDTTIWNLGTEAEDRRAYIKNHIVNFPMMTIGQMPAGTDYKIKGMVTANVSVGTGLFSELSQGFSDMFGVTNVASGMALKVNSGEATARSMLVNRAIAMGANCVIGVDIDYGTTHNNAATVNMQGTAVHIANLDNVLDKPELERAQNIQNAYARIQELGRWLQGEFEQPE